jgi:predicted metalloprotease
MRWDNERLSDNVQDDRGVSFGGGGGGGGGLMLGGGGLGAVVLVGLALLFGVDPRMLLQGGGGGDEQGVRTEAAGPRADDEDARFSRAVLAYTEDTWGEIFQERGARYDPPTLVLYDEGHPTGCGFGQSAMGPFYCPLDHRIYLDLSFFHELSGRFGAPGRFAEAYVIAHEVGHHIQNLLGDAARTQAMQQRAGRTEANRISVRVELQADCYAGVWAERTNRRERILDPGDVEAGLKAASAVGDDTLQRQTQGRVVPDAFTHGSSEQRMRWFRRGFDSGRLEMCDTFQPEYEAL